jgi:hypothetical protein
MPSDVLLGIERSKARARTFGREHTKPQKPGPVTLTLGDEQAPSCTVIPSAHPTTVVAPDGAKGTVIAQLAAGEGATFEVTGTKTIGSGDDVRTVFAWARVVPAALRAK